MIRKILMDILGMFIRLVYMLVSQIGTEPTQISYLAISIILTTVIYNILLIPMTKSQLLQGEKMKLIQPEMEKLQKQFRNQPELLNQKMKELYQKHDYKMSRGCLMMLAMWPIMFAFWGVMRDPGSYIFSSPEAYQAIQKNFFWIEDLGQPDKYIYGMPLINAALQFISMKVMTAQSSTSNQEGNPMSIMMYMMPILIFFTARGFPAGAFLYWMTSILTNMLIRFSLRKSVKIQAAEEENIEISN